MAAIAVTVSLVLLGYYFFKYSVVMGRYNIMRIRYMGFICNAKE